MKPDEIKRMLNCCATSTCDCCPYYGADDYDECTGAMAETALAYIQQLEEHLREATKKVEQLETECNQLKREQDAALHDLSNEVTRCYHCKHHAEGYCTSVAKMDGSCYVWRGVKENA